MASGDHRLAPVASDHYVHDTLDAAGKQFRLLKVWLSPLGVLHGSLRTVDLKTAPPYRCVSYVWGPAPAECSVHVNGYRIMIRKNLHSFFLVYSMHSKWQEDNWIFADQVCIDQSNVSERNHQVQMMGDIYRYATEVVAWLGPNHNDQMTSDFFDLLNNGKNLDLVDSYHRVAAQALKSNIFWTRLWVIPEVILARSLSILVGHSVMEEHGFDRFCVDYVGGYHGIFNLIHSMRHLWISAMTTRYSNLLDLSMAVMNLQCEDPRDKIFGMQSLCGGPRVVVDYDQHIEEVIFEAAKHMVKNCKVFSDLYAVLAWAQKFRASFSKGTSSHHWWEWGQSNFQQLLLSDHRKIEHGLLRDVIYDRSDSPDTYLDAVIRSGARYEDFEQVVAVYCSCKAKVSYGTQLGGMWCYVVGYVLFWLWEIERPCGVVLSRKLLSVIPRDFVMFGDAHHHQSAAISAALRTIFSAKQLQDMISIGARNWLTEHNLSDDTWAQRGLNYLKAALSDK